MTKTPQQAIDDMAKKSIFRFISMDVDGEWYYTDKMPFLDEEAGVWTITNEIAIQGCSEKLEFNGHYSDSLFEAQKHTNDTTTSN